METVKVLIDGEEIVLVTKMDKEDIEELYIPDTNLENTVDLVKELKELEKTIEFKKGDFNE